MTAAEYLSQMVRFNELVFLDTSSMMDPICFHKFLVKAEETFEEAGKKIIISPAVRSELVRLLSSRDPEKRVKAEAAASVISEFKDLFLISGGNLDDEQVQSAFADAELLATLMVNRRRHRQLLISNDRALCTDAFVLNNQASCRGAFISVCYVTQDGDLQMCDCVKAAQQEHLLDKTAGSECSKLEENCDTVQADIHPDKAAVQSRDEAARQRSKPDFDRILTFGLGAVCGLFIGRFGKGFLILIGETIQRFKI